MLGALVECATVTDSALIFTEFLSISCAAALYALLRLWLFLHAFQYWTHLWIVSETCAISAETDSLMTAWK